MKLYISCTDGDYNYGIFKLTEYKIEKNCQKFIRSKRIYADCVFFHYLMKELYLSDFYRYHFIQNVAKNYQIQSLIFYLVPTKYNLIDYNWNERVYQLVRERCELDHTLSWLSTLGGAFSALGDYFVNCAETAGKISIHQLELALRLGDPNIAARCRLYLSLSLIQKQKYKQAIYIIKNEFENAKQASVIDTRLLNMCKGIWCKLQYEYSLFKKCQKRM